MKIKEVVSIQYSRDYKYEEKILRESSEFKPHGTKLEDWIKATILTRSLFYILPEDHNSGKYNEHPIDYFFNSSKLPNPQFSTYCFPFDAEFDYSELTTNGSIYVRNLKDNKGGYILLYDYNEIAGMELPLIPIVKTIKDED